VPSIRFHNLDRIEIECAWSGGGYGLINAPRQKRALRYGAVTISCHVYFRFETIDYGNSEKTIRVHM